ncbi:ionotropic receptor 75a-like [Anticarsia gemmatalis]|uniref:ionotropic receptor 75a-like n=1 Tax=Anticarsia gemmatalis TaxID=129554 RepID=UPI003F771CF3
MGDSVRHNMELLHTPSDCSETMSRLSEQKESSPCIDRGDTFAVNMWGAQRRVTLDVLMTCWGIGTWLGVNGLYVQLPLLVERLPEGWALASSMVLAVQFANVGILLYGVLRKITSRISDVPYIYGLLHIGTLALILNAFLYDKTTVIRGSERSIAYLTLTFFAALVGCTSSVLFYPHLRHFRSVYLATYLMGEGLSGFIPSILALIQGVGGEPECIYPEDKNSTVTAVYPPPRFDTTVFLLLLGGLSAASLVSFTTINNYKGFDSEKVDLAVAAKDEEATVAPESITSARWLGVLGLMVVLNALNNGVMPSVQSYSCMPYGTRAYHLAVTLGAMANPAACLAGVWLRPVHYKLLGVMLTFALLPFCYIMTTALMSPAPPLLNTTGGIFLVVISWVLVSGVVSYARMWVYGWARRGGARGMRACGAVTQLGSMLGSIVTFCLVNYTRLFVQPDVCPALPTRRRTMDVISFIVTYFVTKHLYIMSAFICWPPEKTSEFLRVASEAGIRVRVYTDMRHPPRLSPYELLREAMMVDLQCPDVEYLLHNASSTRAFNYLHAWLLIHNSSYDRSIIEDTLDEYEILPDADVVWAAPDTLVDVYRVKAKHQYLLTNLGLDRNCSKKELESMWGALPSTVTRRKNLRRMMMPAASVIGQPEFFRGWWDVSTRQLDTFPKVTHPLMMLASEDMNFHFNMRQVDFYGVVHPNGSFNGLVGLLQRQEIEVGLASIFMRHDRMREVHYFSETLALTCAFIFRQPSRSAVSNVFLAPFSAGVWSACGVVAASAAVLLVLLRRVRERTHRQSRALLAPLTLPDTCTFALGTMCQQGFHVTPAVSSVRVVMFSTLMTSLFVFTAYSAKIVALLQTPSDALRTIDDLTRSPMTLGVQETTYKKVYFTEAADKSAQQLYKRKIVPQGERAYIGVDEGIARVRTGLFAFQVERSAGYDVITKTFTEREKCALDEIEAFKMPMVCIPMRRYSGYRELFAVRMRWQREVGLMGQARRVWLVPRPRCETDSGGFVSIGIIDVLPALQALALGAGLAVALLGAELMLHAFSHRAACWPRHSSAQTALVGDTRFN